MTHPVALEVRRRALPRITAPAIIQAALCIRAGLTPPDDELANRAEDSYGPHGLTLRAACKEMLSLCGLPDPGNTPGQIQAAFSGGDAAELFDGLVNTALMAPFKSSADTTRGWIVEREVENFKNNRRTRIQQAESLAPLPRGGAAEMLSVDALLAEEYRVQRFARQFTVDEMDLVSDDVDALMTPATIIGDAALRLKLDLVYLVMLANANMADGVALFHADHGNLDTGAALATDKLDEALAGMELQTENAKPIDTVAKYLLVPPQKRGLARRLAQALELAGDPDNLIARSEPRLSDGVTDPVTGTAYAGSSTDWYLAGGNGAPTIEFGYIDTNRPRSSRWVLKDGAWGVGYSIKWDVGAKALAHEALHKAEA